MKTIKSWYNPAQKKCANKKEISLISLFSWVAVLMVIVMFWASIAVAYKKDYVPHVIAKIEHKEKRFLANHKAIQKRLSSLRSLA